MYNKSKKVIIICILITLVLGVGIGVGASTLLYSKDVTYDNSSSGMSATTVQAALDELYEQAKSAPECDSEGNCTVTCPSGTNYVATSTGYKCEKSWAFDYTGGEQEFVVPVSGTYKIELWGAGAGIETSGGGYVAGKINLTKDDNLYLYVGGASKTPTAGSGATTPATFNGGGTGGYGGTYSDNYYSGKAGGGATDIRLQNGAWNDATSLRSRIMVAGGAGGSFSGTSSQIGFAGGLKSLGMYRQEANTINSSYYANQTSGYAFGQGGPGANTGGGSFCSGHGGGGGGYYGGRGGIGGYGSSCYFDTGVGGSSFISGHAGCVAIASENSTTPKSGCTDGTTDVTCSYHYSGYKFTDTIMIDGAGYEWTTTRGTEVVGMPTHDGSSIMYGNTGNGYAKITFIN